MNEINQCHFKKRIQCCQGMVIFLIVTLSLIYSGLIQADTVDRYIQTEMQNEKIPGLSIAVIQDGKVVKAQGYGYANVELKVPATAETIYQSGSMGKQFTATLVMMLAEQGKLNINDKISKYLPNTPPSWENITVRNLLTHTSGIKDYDKHTLNYRLDYTDDQLLAIIKCLPLDFQPGTQWKYSNTGYVLLGIIIKNITGKFYGDLLHQYIFVPLGMNTARIINESDIILNRAAGYQLIQGQLKNQDYVSPSLDTTADGSLYFSVLDLIKWDTDLNTNKLLAQKDLQLMWTPVKLSNGKLFKNESGYYGFGWHIDSINGHRIIQHGGQWQGFSTYIARYPDDKLTVIVLTNLAHAPANDIVHHVAGMYISALMPHKF